MKLKDVQEMKKDIDRAKVRKSESEGALKTHLKQLEEEFGCESLKEGRSKLETFREKAATLTKKIDEKIEELEEVSA